MKQISKKINRIKDRLKTGAVVSGIVLSGLTASQKASAQQTQQSPKDLSSLVIDLDKSNSGNIVPKTDDNLYQFFYKSGKDDGIVIDRPALARSLLAANLSSQSKQVDDFCQAYSKYMDSEGKITFLNFNKVLEESLTPEQIQAFCENLTKEFQNNEPQKVVKKQNRSSEKNKTTPSVQNDGEWRTIKKDNVSLRYAFKDTKMFMEGNISGNINKLLPPVTKLKNGNYKCGTSVSANYSTATQMERLHITQLILRHYIYNDLLERGDTSTPSIQDFLSRHKRDMEKHGIAVDENGNFYQKNNPSQMKMLQDKLSLNK